MRFTIAEYVNGNVSVRILNDGTKIRQYEDTPQIIHPESMDVKITNYCDMGCEYCHEESTLEGKHADLTKLLDIIKDLPAGVEVAIGGGNPLSHPNLLPFLEELDKRGIIANITVNQGHLSKFGDLLVLLIKRGLVKGVGISVTSMNFKYVTPLLQLTDNIVFHVIAGVNDIDILGKLRGLNSKVKILILGYKTFGRGVTFFNDNVRKNLDEWNSKLRNYLRQVHLSFDNLAIEQLNVKDRLSDEEWEQFYMGDDFTYTMYIDAVDQMYAPTSRSNDRLSFEEYSLLDFFRTRLDSRKFL